MSDFASLLSSFQKAASSATTAAPTKKPHANPSRKRPPPAAAPSHFPSLHTPSHKHHKASFELSFLVIGGQKCGTTWIHNLLQKCHRLSLPKQKEVHYWDWHYRKGMDWYIRQFVDHHCRPRRAAPDNNHDDDTSRSKLYGEITPDYVVLPPSTIAEIHAHFPHLKIIFVARDFVDRAWSAMVMELHDRTMGLNPGEFAEGVVDGTERHTPPKRSKVKSSSSISVAQRRRMEQGALPSSQPDSYFLERLEQNTHDSRSDYARGLRNWYAHFSAKSILLIDYREIQSNPRDVLFQIVKHVGVEEGEARRFVEELAEEEVRRRVNASTGVRGSGENREKDSSESLLKRPLLKKCMERYLSRYAVDFNALLKEKGYSWELNDYKGMSDNASK